MANHRTRTAPPTTVALRLVTVVCASVTVLGVATALAQPPQPGSEAPTTTFQGMSPAALAQIVESAKPDAPATLTFFNRDIVTLRAAVLGRSSADRVGAARHLVAEVARTGVPLPVSSRTVAGAQLVTVGNRDVLAIVPADVDELLGETLPMKTETAALRLRDALDAHLDATRPRTLLLAALQAGLMTFAVGLGLVALVRIRHRLASFLAATARRAMAAASKLTEEIARQTRVIDYVHRTCTLLIVAIAIAAVYVWLTFVLNRFPYSRPWGLQLRGFVVDRLTSFGMSILHAVPALFTIALIVLFTRFCAKLVQVIFVRVEQGRLEIPGVYPETAAPTRKLITALLWVFAIIVSYPYIPGSESEVFRGVSVLLGLMVSLGSGGLVNQIMSGFTVMYARALRRGDYVRVDNLEGTVTQIGTLSTKIETARREEITIPNAVLVSRMVTNFSRNHETVGVYTPTSVTIGYDTPWRQVEALLLMAATKTEKIRKTPPPVVLQSSLEEFCVRYTLLVALETPNFRTRILDALHANIQDAFNEHGVQIMTPRYETDPQTRKVVAPDQWFAAPAIAPTER